MTLAGAFLPTSNAWTDLASIIGAWINPSKMHLAAEEWYDKVDSPRSSYYVKYSQWVDTASQDTNMQEVALGVFASIQRLYPELALQLTSA